MNTHADLSEIIGKTFTSVVNTGDEIIFKGDVSYKLYHDQDCCESVGVEDVCGDLNDLVGTPIVSVSEDINFDDDGSGGDQQWTFYHFRTHNGTVTIRFYGTSNGYYSTGVSFARLS